MPAKQIILLLDGTWNDADFGTRDTNIVRMRGLIARHLQTQDTTVRASLPDAGQATKEQKLAVGYANPTGTETLVFYERGVGTGASDSLTGGALGKGLDGNIRRAYKFLSYWYLPGDQVFVFGFSRGAFTGRSLVGYLAAAGLLRREACNPENEANAWNYYRTVPNDRMPGTWSALAPLVHDRDEFRIALIGVFDTVGALGIPGKWMWKRNREKYQFHDVELSSITRVNLHAMAIDEHRLPFEAAVWRKPKFKRFTSHTEQVWFPGAHADVGGSYVDEEKRGPDAIRALDDVTLSWMLKRVKRHVPEFPCDVGHLDAVDEAYVEAQQHNPRKRFYRVFRFAWRAMANHDPGSRWWRHEATVSRDRHGEPIAEMVHVSALERLGKRVPTDMFTHVYRPRNLLSVLPAIRRAYRLPGSDAGPEVLVVDWTGEVISADDQAGRQRVIDLLTIARTS